MAILDKVSYSEYIKELSAEEQDSLKKYQSVNIEAKPFRHVEKIRKKQQPLKKKIKKISEMEATEINVRIKKAQPKPIFIPPDLFF
jgi:lipid II:glycine glycyltransferase (peptidoglycan interpeptide bridge formation enzyme)